MAQSPMSALGGAAVEVGPSRPSLADPEPKSQLFWLLITSVSTYDHLALIYQPQPLRSGTMQKNSVFLNYRRQDASQATGRLFDRLGSAFGRDAVFMDIDSIPFGSDFAGHIREQLNCCKVVIPIIGKDWLSCTAGLWPFRRRRIDGKSDWVRKEIEIALERSLPMIPVLVDGASMPQPALLPTSIALLANKNAISLRHDRFGVDCDTLIHAIGLTIGSVPRGQALARELATIPPPLASGVKGYHNDSTHIFIGDPPTRVPITLTKRPSEPIDGAWDYNIDFSITNPGKLDIRILSVAVSVEKWEPLEDVVAYLPFAGIGTVKRFVCRAGAALGEYKCEWIGQERDAYISLKGGELEAFSIALNSAEEGKYQFAVKLRYLVADREEVATIGLIEEVRILDRRRIHSLPRPDRDGMVRPFLKSSAPAMRGASARPDSIGDDLWRALRTAEIEGRPQKLSALRYTLKLKTKINEGIGSHLGDDEFVAIIKEAADATGIDLAELLRNTIISRPTLSRWLVGKTLPPEPLRWAILSVLLGRLLDHLSIAKDG